MRRITRRDALTILTAAAATSVVAACRRSGGGTPARDALTRAEAWLQAQQAADGGFPSETYGFFSAGQSTTPLVTLALLMMRSTNHTGLASAAKRMIELRGEDGASGFASQVPDYPVYSTALTLSCLRRLEPERTGPSAAWLRSQQFRVADGWGEYPAGGGFGMGSKFALKPPHAGHVDLSMTRVAVQALVTVGWDGADEAKGFIDRCRAEGGGFVYSPVQPALNKGALQAGYGSPTCDGILALRALGVDTAEETAFLAGIHRVDRNPGLEGGPMEAFGPAMRGYYRAGSAEVFATGGGPEGWKEAMTTAILAEQKSDGRWQNESHLQKEDDPLIATAFAVLALSAVERAV